MSKTVVTINPTIKVEEPKKVAIIFTHVLLDLAMHSTNKQPEDYANVELLVKGYQYTREKSIHIGKHDLMLAFDESRSDGILFIGQFNDGVVEE
jgi:hypothetical protein